ncbi:MAG: TPMT family class I SAM-dependent methyltransferase [Flavobacteriales bacterium]|nr:TPMT family class I SAM-dependent methyltransferase [Flavobacteriales bacterium]
MKELTEAFWSGRYSEGKTGWDIGEISTPLKTYIDHLSDKNLRILVPGCGKGHEAAYLWEQGFKNTFVVDLAQAPLDLLREAIPEIPTNHLLHGNFFELKGEFELILEQTFFCALSPSLRKNYAEKMHELLADGGKLVGLLFDFPLTEDGPPFGGNKEEYLTYFEPHFEIVIMERAYNSIQPRSGRELFVKLEKK